MRQLTRLIDESSLDAFLDEADRERPPRVRLNVGFDGVLKSNTWLAPTLRRRIALSPDTDGEVEVTVGGAGIRLSGDARRVLQVLFEEDGISFGALAEKLAIPPEDARLRNAVLQLSAKGLCSIESQ